MTKFVVQTECHLNADGRFGAGLVIGGPIVAGFAYWWLINELARPKYTFEHDNSWLAALILGAAAIGTLVGFVLLFKGRSYRHDVTVIKDD